MARKTKSDQFTFQGFQSPNYTMVPDELFDQLMVELTGAELKVLLYIIRRTFGFKRESDHISLSQMLNGLHTRDGRVLDRGVGLTKKTLLQALNSLEEKHVILTERRQSPEKGNEPTAYRLHVLAPNSREKSTPPLGEKVHQGVGAEIPPRARGKKYATQKTEEDKELKDLSTIREVHTQEEKEEERQGAATKDFEPIGTTLRHRPHQHGREVYDEDRQVILEYIQDFAREFGDQAPLKSSVSRAYNLYRQAGRSREAFIAALYQARAITKERSASIGAHETGATRSQRAKSKMPYFFSVLADLLGLRPEAEGGETSG